MIKLGIDARLYFQTGVGTYIRNLIYYLEKKIDSNWKIFIYLWKDDFEKANFRNKRFIKIKVSDRWHSFSEQIRFLKILNKEKLNLIHFPYFSYPFFYNRPFVSTIHDLTPLFFKTGKASTKNILEYYLKLFVLKNLLNKQIKKSLSIFCPSKTVKNQLISLYGKAINKKINVTLEGVDNKLIRTNPNHRLKSIFYFPFFIYIGNFYPHKNIDRLIKAFSQVKCQEKLILVGPMDFFTKRLIKLINDYRQNQRIIFYHQAQASDLVFFYKNAKALICPSLSEGFGLPLIEAAYFNCPIIASEIEVFKEILNNNYLSFNPYREDDIKNKIEFFLKNKPIYDYKNIIKKYSFEKMTEETLIIYNKILK